jgi:hypothetical protein
VLLESYVAGTGRPIVVLPSLDLPGTGGSPPGEPTSDAVLADVIATLDAALGTDES